MGGERSLINWKMRILEVGQEGKNMPLRQCDS